MSTVACATLYFGCSVSEGALLDNIVFLRHILHQLQVTLQRYVQLSQEGRATVLFLLQLVSYTTPLLD